MLTHSNRAHDDSAPDLPDPIRCPRCYLDRFVVPAFRALYPLVRYDLVDAASYGVPQNRRRVLFYAGPEGYELPTTLGATIPASFVLPGVAYLRAEGDGAVGRPTSRPSPSQTTKGYVYAYDDDPGRRDPSVKGLPRGSKTPGGRRLLPSEAARLQCLSNPDSYDRLRTKGDGYRLAGNALPPPVAEAFGRSVMRVLR